MKSHLLGRLNKIVSGGQTGADRAALDFAIEKQVPYGGWCPKGGWAEDFPNPPGILLKYPGLSETPDAKPEQRTEWNVRDSSLTLILLQSNELQESLGTVLTKRTAEQLGRPCYVADMSIAGLSERVTLWLGQNLQGGILNVAGPRESESPGLYVRSRSFLADVLGE